jgi:hypothetical protein
LIGFVRRELLKLKVDIEDAKKGGRIERFLTSKAATSSIAEHEGEMDRLVKGLTVSEFRKIRIPKRLRSLAPPLREHKSNDPRN